MAAPQDPTRNPHPLAPDGTFRGNRLPAALGEGYAPVDGKSAGDWLEVSRRLAYLLRYTDAGNQVSGDWSPFYERHGVVAVARLLAWPVDGLVRRLAEHRELIEDRQGTLPPEQLLKSLFDLLTSAVVALERLMNRLPVASPVRERAESLVVHQLAPAFGRWLAYYRAAAPVYFVDLGPDQVPDYLRDTYAAGGEWIDTRQVVDGTVELTSRWTAGRSWPDYLTAIGTDTTVYGTAPSEAGAAGEILHAVGHVFFHGVYELIVSSLFLLRSDAKKTWNELDTAADHPPHLAVLLAYLRMRERQREMLNQLTDRHLHFYYQRVLRTQPAPARPPRALLYLEARKNLPPTHLPAGTAFRGGKDANTGTERVFRSQSAITVGPAKIVEKRAVFRVADDPSVYAFPGEHRKVFASATAGRYYAAPVVDSGDGTGEVDLPEEQHGWFPFGHRNGSGTYLTAGMPPARLGLAIASHYLYLREGDRTITLRFPGMAEVPAPAIALRAYLTTEEGWHETDTELLGNEMTLHLPPTVPAILPYREEVHAQGLTTELPVVRLELPQDATTLRAHGLLAERSFTRVLIGLTVTGVRNIMLSGTAGTIDPSKPFHPFGAAPRKGDVLIIGNGEVFQKYYASVTYRWSWTDGTGTGDVRFDQATLEDGGFGGAERTNQSLNQGYLTDVIAVDDVTEPDFVADRPYEAGMARGYVRFKLRGDWGHAAYPTALTVWAANKARWVPDDENELPPQPFNPEFADFSLDYTLDPDVAQVRDGQQGRHQLFHLTPFGSDPLPAAATFAFLPEILPQSGEAVGADAGALYLGIREWEPGTQLSLLLEIAEGTADPLLEKPDGHLHWHYLDGNRWREFDRDALFDGTDALLRSGLVRLDLPAGTRAINHRFNDDLQWLRLSVESRTDAVNRLLGVHAHGVEVVQDFGAGQSAGDAPLPAGTIAKLVIPLAGIKSVHQDYPTFGGAAPEHRDAYFTRLSERLRHRDRAITEWDVEHLVLGAFPAVERVICLQHLEFSPGATAGTYVYHELRAGHFTVLLLGRSGERGLRPYVSLSTREAVEEYLRDRLSCHATLHVRNPLFEEVQVRGRVRYRAGTDLAWAEGQIQADLIDFISPWHDEGLAGLDFTAEVHRSAVVNFLEELDYVDFVSSITLHHLSDPSQNDSERLRPTRLVSVLVSAPTHLLTPTEGTVATGPTEVCSPVRRRIRRITATVTENPIVG